MERNLNRTASSTALQLEGLMLNKAMEEINEWSRISEEDAVRDFAARGLLQSGRFVAKIASIHRERAKRMVDKRIALRRETIKQAPELATDGNFKSLLDSVGATVDGVFNSIDTHLKRVGVQIALGDGQPEYQLEIRALKAYANLEIEILKREVELRLANIRVRNKRKDWIGPNMDRTNQILAVLVASILSAAAVLASLNHKVLPYWFILLSGLIIFLAIGREIWQRNAQRP